MSAGVEYVFPVGKGTLIPRIQWSHVDEQLATPFPSSTTIVPSRSLWDARLTWDSGGMWLVEAFATNFADETYIASQIQNSTSATGGIIYGAPLQFGARVRLNFGD